MIRQSKKTRRIPLILAAPALLLATLLASCSAKPAAGLVVAIQTDVPLPKDVDDVRLEVLTYGSLQFGNDYAVGAGQLLIPATLTLLPGADPATPATIRLLARQNGKIRMLRETVTTVPSTRVATLRMPIQWLCEGQATEMSGVVQSTCPTGTTCDNGSCVTTDIDQSTLIDYQAENIFGGGSDPSSGTCFDLLACFANGAVATVDMSDCSIADPGGGNVNVALSVSVASGDGQCGENGCLVPVRSGGSGWKRSAGRIALPHAVCTDARVVSVLLSTGCASATADTPLCGSWSGIGSASHGNGGGSGPSTDAGATMTPDAGLPDPGVDSGADGVDTCCIAQDGPGCSNTAVMQCVCAMAPDCCQTSWSPTCVTDVALYKCPDTCPPQ